MELILEEDWPAETLLRRLNDSSVEGLDFIQAVPLEEKRPKQQPLAFAYEMNVPKDRVDEVREKIAAFLSAETFEVEKTNGKAVDARSPVKELTLDGASLRLVLTAQSGPEAGVREILVCLGLDGELFRTIFPNRVRSYIVDEEENARS